MNTPLSPSQAKRIAYKFFELYYNVITSNEYEKVLDYYVPDATFSRYGLNTSNSTEFKGLDAFRSELKTAHEKFNQFETHIKTIDAQPLSVNMILVSVIIELVHCSNVNHREMFVHTIVLAGHTSEGNKPSYHVTNDMIRYIELPTITQPQKPTLEKEAPQQKEKESLSTIKKDETKPQSTQPEIKNTEVKEPTKKETTQPKAPVSQGPRTWANIVSPQSTSSSTTITSESSENTSSTTERSKPQHHKGGRRSFDGNRRGGYAKQQRGGGHKKPSTRSNGKQQ